jgi:ATP-dependent Clp protease ATP-binding subunit ClpA
VDGLGWLLRSPHGSDHLLELRRALKERRIHVVGVLFAHDYDGLLAANHALQELTTRIDMAEPDREAARDMVSRAADGLADEFGIPVEDHAVARAVVLAGEFIAHQKLPLSVIRSAAPRLRVVPEEPGPASWNRCRRGRNARPAAGSWRTHEQTQKQGTARTSVPRPCPRRALLPLAQR